MGIPAWTIRTPLGEYHARVRFFGPSPEPEEAEQARSVWFFASCDIRNLEADAVEAALELRAELSGGAELAQRVRMDDAQAEQLIEELDNALTAGLMYFERVEWSSPPSPDAEDPVAPSQLEQRLPVHWVEMRFRDGGARPIVGVNYTVTLPDGTDRTGRLDSQGKTRHERQPSGTATLLLADIEEARWGTDETGADTPVELSIVTRGIRAGEAVTFEVFRRWGVGFTQVGASARWII